MGPLIMVFVVIVFVVTIITIIKIKEAKSARKAREHALTLGLSLPKCTRDVPYWLSHDFNKPPEFKKKKEFGYCLKYPSPRRCQWSLLQRESEPGSEFPPAWRLVVDKGKINENLKGVLLQIAEEQQNHYLEIVSTADNVCIYWKEWGGKMMADKIHAYLNDIIKASL